MKNMKNMNIKGIVSVGTKFHAYYTASALDNNNMLEFLIAGKKNNHTTLSEKKIKNISVPQYIGAAIRKIKFINNFIPYNIVSDKLFDKLALKKINKDIDFFIGFNNYVLEQMKLLKNKGTLLILDQRTVHGNTERQVGIDQTGKIPDNLCDKMMQRKQNEIELADYILVPSKFVYNSMIDNGVERDKLIYLPYGYNPDLFYVSADNNSNSDELKLIFVGAIGYRKGCKYLLEAIKKVKESGLNVSLIMVGNIDYNFKEIFDKYKDIVDYKGFVSNHELVRLYNEADLFIFPSLCEGSALVTYEAAACGLPLIVTENTGSIVEHEKDGIIIKPKDKDEIFNSVVRLYNDRLLIKKMKNNILLKIKNYTWEEYEKKLVCIINDKLNERNNYK